MARRLTIADLQRYTGVSDEQLELPISDNNLHKIAEKISDFEMFASKFELEAADIKTAKESPYMEYAKRTMIILNKWKSKCGPKANYRCLVKISLELEQGQLADEICKLCAKYGGRGFPQWPEADSDTQPNHRYAGEPNLEQSLLPTSRPANGSPAVQNQRQEESHVYQFCGEVPQLTTPPSKGVDNVRGIRYAFGSVRMSQLWDMDTFDAEPLKVHFINPELFEEENWRVGKNLLTENLVLTWAKGWNPHSKYYPKIADVYASKKAAQIRVLFTSTERSRSFVGSDAMKVPKSKPTMYLNLFGKSEADQRSLVLHEFGHALGLDHEHQRSDFWKRLQKFTIGKDKMKSGNDGQCAKAGEEHFKKEFSGPKKESSYDPDSIMHYWFDINWLLPEYQDRDYVERGAELEEKERDAILGVHKRCYENGELAKNPSDMDFIVLNKAYEQHGGCGFPQWPEADSDTQPEHMYSYAQEQQSTLPTSRPASSTKPNNLTIKKTPKYYCTVKEEDVIYQAESETNQIDAASGWVRRHLRWDMSYHSNLKIHFLNPEVLEEPGWNCGDHPLNITTILAWAATWNTNAKHYPTLEEAPAEKKDAHIRVKFDSSNSTSSWSKIGKAALRVSNKDEPTMVLNLHELTVPDQKSMVLHEFGHALGLEHEHQRSDFWHVLETREENGDWKFIIGKDRMKSGDNGNCSKACDAVFKSNIDIAADDVTRTKYDPESIMHYWFDVNWLCKSYRDLGVVETDEKLTPKERAVLKGVHTRDYQTGGRQASNPSQSDYDTLNKAYRSQHPRSPFSEKRAQKTDTDQLLSPSVISSEESSSKRLSDLRHRSNQNMPSTIDVNKVVTVHKNQKWTWERSFFLLLLVVFVLVLLLSHSNLSSRIMIMIFNALSRYYNH